MTRLQDPAPEILRDTWGRPYVLPPGGSKPIPYTRCTTFAGAIEDTFKISQWSQRHVARGVASHPELIQAILDTDPDDKDAMNSLAEQAKEVSGAGDAARLGIYLHSLTEAADRGWDLASVPIPMQSYGPLDPTLHIADMAAYLKATEDLTAISIEQFSVLDHFKVAGTPDRVVKYRGERYIADLKTGTIEWGALKIAAQLAIYSRSTPYHQPDHQRLDPHGASTSRGIIIHLPAGTGTCRLYWIDLEKGWQAVLLSRNIREARRQGFRHLTTELLPLPQVSLADQIRLASTADEVRALWFTNAGIWTDDLTEIAKAHISTLNPITEGATA